MKRNSLLRQGKPQATAVTSAGNTKLAPETRVDSIRFYQKCLSVAGSDPIEMEVNESEVADELLIRAFGCSLGWILVDSWTSLHVLRLAFYTLENILQTSKSLAFHNKIYILIEVSINTLLKA